MAARSRDLSLSPAERSRGTGYIAIGTRGGGGKRNTCHFRIPASPSLPANFGKAIGNRFSEASLNDIRGDPPLPHMSHTCFLSGGMRPRYRLSRGTFAARTLPLPWLQRGTTPNRYRTARSCHVWIRMELLLHATSLGLIALLLFVLLVVATQVGRIVGRHQRKRVEDKDASTLATGMLGIFALLIAFTYSLSLARYDARRGMVLQEANAIGTTANYALMLPPAHRPQVMGMLRDYTRLRTGLGAPYDEGKFARDVQASNQLLAHLWQQASSITAEQPQSLPA